MFTRVKTAVTFGTLGSVGLSGTLGMVGLFFLAGRPLSDLKGYFRAGALTTVKSIENEIPDVVHDEKTETEIATAREQMVERLVQLSMSQNQQKNLEHEIKTLQSDIDDRSQVLASAYPVMQQAIDGNKTKVTFVTSNFSIQEFQQEIDDLLSTQERDENALRIKQAGYERLKKSVADGEEALSAMKNQIEEIGQEFDALKTRRDQARMEAETLDLVAGATFAGKSSSASVGKSIDRLEGQVEQLEARNSARRDVASVDQRAKTGKLTKSFNRLDALKKYADQRTETSGVTDANGSTSADASRNSKSTTTASEPFSAEEVVIHVKGAK